MPLKSGKQIKEEILIRVNIYIDSFKDKEKDSAYFDGYRAAWNTIKDTIEGIDLGDEDTPKEKTEKPKEKTEKPKDPKDPKVTYL